MCALKTRWICIALVVMLVLSICSCQNSRPDGLEIHFLDVGQGDAILIRTTDGDILIDAGPDDAQETLCLRLEALGVKSLALAVFTHSDEDHIGGGDGVLRRFPAETVWISDCFEQNEATRQLLYAADATRSEVVCVEAGRQFALGDAVLTVFAPIGDCSDINANDASIVLKLVYGDVSAMLMGDAETALEQRLLASYDPVHFQCDLLKVAHHGASTSSGMAFLQAARPQYAVIGCAAGNYYGHPHGEVLARLEAVGAEVFRTDLSGDIVFVSDGRSLQYREQ